MVKVLDKSKLLDFMGKRKDSLYDQITRDFGGRDFGGRIYNHYEVKYWKEAIERGEFDTDIPEVPEITQVYVIMTLTNELAGFTFYTDEDAIIRRVRELNEISGAGVYWYITLDGDFRNLKNLVPSGR